MLTDDVLVHTFQGSEVRHGRIVAHAITFRVEVHSDHRPMLVL